MRWDCSINRIMNQTSLHNIISRNTSGIREAEIRQFFVPQEYPRFEIDDLQAKPHLMLHAHFAMFMGVLSAWNQKVERGDSTLNETDYRKNEFIFSWLKSIAVQNIKFLESSLQQLHKWYSSNSDFDFPKRMRPQNTNKSRMEDWEIRNSYKSNMPLEIENYRRRILLQQNSNAEAQTPSQTPKTPLSRIKSLDRLQGELLKKGKKENNYLRGVREDLEMSEFQTTFKRSKVNFYKNMSKNYYKPQFSRDKLQNSCVPKVRQQIDASQFLKDYRIKTSMGFRPFGEAALGSLNTSFTRTQPAFFRPNKADLSVSMSYGSPDKLNASNIDGLSLMTNPFETKLKKKKK